MRFLFLVAMAMAMGLSLSALDNANAESHHICFISESGMGPIRLGMTLGDAKKAMPTADFQRSTDGDGAALVTVRLGKEDLITLFANEENPDGPIDWTKKVNFIETFNPACNTAEGIHPGLPVIQVEKILGKTKEIVRSEIESREFIDFQKQPPRFFFRVDGAGIFTDGTRRTTRFAPEGKIWSIAVTK